MGTVTLHNSTKIPALGLGTWRADKRDVTSIVEEAILDHGYRHVDCASIYGNEKEIGQAFNNVLSSGRLSREELFVTSKLWNTDHHPENVEKACRQTLKDLQVGYLDLYLVHWGIAFVHGEDLEPMGANGLVKTEPVSIQQTWQAMEKLVEKGLVKNIGVANFTVPMLVDLLSYAKIKPVMNQVEIHPYNTQEELVSYCHKQGIHITAYSPLGSAGHPEEKPLQDPLVKQIAEKYSKTPAQILIKFALQRGLAVIPKSTNSGRVAENSNVDGFVLTEEDMNHLYALNKNCRFVDPVKWWGVPYFK